MPAGLCALKNNSATLRRSLSLSAGKTAVQRCVNRQHLVAGACGEINQTSEGIITAPFLVHTWDAVMGTPPHTVLTPVGTLNLLGKDAERGSPGPSPSGQMREWHFGGVTEKGHVQRDTAAPINFFWVYKCCITYREYYFIF